MGNARTAALHATTDYIPVVLVVELNMADSSLNAPCQLSSLVEWFASGVGVLRRQ